MLVERSAALRVEHGRFPRADPTWFGLGPARLDADGIGGRASRGRSGRRQPGRAASDGPAEVILANELLDNLAFHILHRGEGLAGGAGRDRRRGGAPRRGAGPERGRQVRAVGELVPDTPTGARVPVQDAAGAWLRRAAPRGARWPGRVFDYAATTAELAARPSKVAADLRRPRARWALLDRPASRTSPSTCASTSSPGCARRPREDRQADLLASTASTSSSTRVAACGRTAPLTTSRRCRPAAA